MARPKKSRRVCMEPTFISFIPDGASAEGTVYLSVEEYESVRLIDYEKMTQEECAVQMGVARTTVTDIYMKARYKMADCIIHGNRLEIGGGNYSICSHREGCHGPRGCRFRQNGSRLEKNGCRLRQNDNSKILQIRRKR